MNRASGTGQLTLGATDLASQQVIVAVVAEFVICDCTIETLFAILKSRGFRFEETHLTAGDRGNKFLAPLTLATVWAFEVGE